MFSLRNGSLFANALLVAIGAAAGAGVTVLLTPLLSDTSMQSRYRDAVPGGSPERGHALTPAPGGSSGSDGKDGVPSLSAASATRLMKPKASEKLRKVKTRRIDRPSSASSQPSSSARAARIASGDSRSRAMVSA